MLGCSQRGAPGVLQAARKAAGSLVAAQRKPEILVSLPGVGRWLTFGSVQQPPPLCIASPASGARWQSSAAAPAASVASSPSDDTPTSSAKPARAPRKKRDVLVMTDGAIERVKELLKDKDPPPYGIRLGVRTRGCNGLSYTLNYVYEPQKLDDVVEAGGVKVYIDPKAVMYLVGSRMDFVEDAVKAEFVFENPNAKGACGCGESFNV